MSPIPNMTEMVLSKGEEITTQATSIPGRGRLELFWICLKMIFVLTDLCISIAGLVLILYPFLVKCWKDYRSVEDVDVESTSNAKKEVSENEEEKQALLDSKDDSEVDSEDEENEKALLTRE
ncbi:hypothetical protein NHQ30_008335 [Ciborinia camelliae]|nr:hypothetical protein NHQ30_008335 [Ciborinia camelliae]